MEKIDAKQIIELLDAYHDAKEWAFFEELRIGTGFGKDSEQRLDAWAIHYHPSKKNVVRCYEIKVSKSDFKKELESPLKRRPGIRLSNEFYFIAPAGIIDHALIPPECGLMEVIDGAIVTVIPAPFRDVFPPTWNFVAAICRNFDKPRAYKWAAFEEDTKVRVRYRNLALDMIGEHIEKWQNFRGGNKETPDKIAEALKALEEAIKDAIKNPDP